MPEGRTISLELKIAVIKKCNSICQRCGERGNPDFRSGCALGQEKKPLNYDCTTYYRIPMEFDHIIPLSKGGKTELKNLQLLCRKCNRNKGAKDA